MTAAQAPAKTPLSKVTPSGAQLEEATRKAAAAKTKAKQAKAALKNAKKAFKLARKTAKAAHVEVNTLQEAITRAEEHAAPAAGKARAARRAPRRKRSRPSATSKPRPPLEPKPVRKTPETASSTLPSAEKSRTEGLRGFEWVSAGVEDLRARIASGFPFAATRLKPVRS